MISFKKNSLLTVTILILSFLQFAFAIATPYFSDVKILDSYTQSTDVTNLDHWFIIQPKITIPAESSTDPIQITIPLAFGSYNSGSFDLMYGTTTVGTVNIIDGSNTLTVSFNTYVTTLQSEIDVEFNLLAKFSKSAKELVNKPMSLSYIVNATNDKTFQPTLNFIGTDLTTITTDGGVYGTNNTAWFVINVPISSLNGALTIQVNPTGSNSFYYDTDFTNLQVVTAVDEFNNPTASVPFTAYQDKSTAASLFFNLTSNISGGKYLRIAYASGPLMYDAITNEVTINSNTNLDNTVYTDSVTNVELNSASGISALDMGLLSSNITTPSSTTSSAADLTASTANAITEESSTPSSDISTADDSLISPEAETLDSLIEEDDDTNSTTTSSSHSSVVISTISTDIVSPISSSVSVVTSSRVSNSTTDVSSIISSGSISSPAAVTASVNLDAESINATIISKTSSTDNLGPSTTSPLDYNSNMTVSTTRTAADNDTYETYTVLKSTSSAEVTEITKLIPIATLSGSTISSEVVITSTIGSNARIDADDKFVNSTSSAVSSSSTYSTSNSISTSAITNTTNTSGASVITSTKLSTHIITTTSCSKNVCYLATSTSVSTGYIVTTESCSEDAIVKTNLVPVSTLACSTCAASKTVVSEAYVVNSETQDAKATTNTKLVPVATLTRSTTTTTKNNVDAEHKTTTILTAAVDETIVSYTTKSCSTTKISNSVSIGDAYVETRETQSASVTSYLNFLGGSSITKSSTPTTTTHSTVEILVQSTKSANHSSSYTVAMYEAGSSQLTIGLGTFIVSLFTLLL
ncbi:hypothetical protein C6P45_003712 [Maudiozyma exigua]|uniref:Uncharacterized protein n=1 Tax=Maudiozyma exigua TaxID=34358 RepID=A0A9P6WHC1_MAUEX|nr:hypothetical protein C6P45_003712 [Kazachstania exigua]